MRVRLLFRCFSHNKFINNGIFVKLLLVPWSKKFIQKSVDHQPLCRTYFVTLPGCLVHLQDPLVLPRLAIPTVLKKNRLSVVFVVGLSRGGRPVHSEIFLWVPPLPLPLPLPTASLVNPPTVSHRRKMDPHISMVCHKHILEQALYIQVCDRLDFQFRTLMAINDIGNDRTFCAHTFIPGFPSRPWLPTGPGFPCNEQ